MQTPEGEREVINTDGATSSISQGHRPLLTCDVREQAYCIDYRDARLSYLETFWNLVNWKFVAQNISGRSLA